MLRADPSRTPVLGTVILLHGHGRTTRSMAGLARALAAAGHRPLPLGYNSRAPMAAIVASLAPRVAAATAGNEAPVHFVTHSLGGLVARALLAEARPARLGRVVMLAPPNGGSELADALHRWGLGELLLGPVGAFLRTRRTRAVAAALGAVNYELGVIAGDRQLFPALSQRFIPGAGDGKVAVAATRVAGMTDHLVLPVPHTLMVHDARVAAEVCAYLATGAFARSAASRAG